MSHDRNDAQSQYTKMLELRQALPGKLTQGVYNDEAQFCAYVKAEHPDAARTQVRAPGTDEQDTWVDTEGKVVAIWNSQFQVGAATFSNLVRAAAPLRMAA